MRFAVQFLVLTFGLSNLSTAEAAGSAASPTVVPNRTVPQVEPPKAALEFSASPTPAELFRARVFEEPLVPVGAEPSAPENAALAAALLGYSKRSGPDDFASLTGFLDQHPQSPWAAALLTGLGLEYYNTAHYSLALEAWAKAWSHAKDVTDAKGKAIMDRAAGELAYMYARLGRMTELEALLKSFEGRVFRGSATEKIAGARQGLWNMQHRPEIAFRCGPLALHRIKLSLDPHYPAAGEIFKSASTQRGFSLPQVAELSKKIGLNYQMGFREKGGALVVPSVVHWKVGHYAALVRQEGDRYLVQDPTFRNDVWATRQALEAESSGYFLIPPGSLPQGWRAVEANEGAAVWGKGHTHEPDPNQITKRDAKTTPNTCTGMAVSGVHLMVVNLNLIDQPVGYAPPVGPAVRFTVRYNEREAAQPANFAYGNFGAKWTCDWISYITDSPSNLLADVKYYVGGGGRRTFTGFNPATQSFGYQQYDETLLTRTGTNSYELLSRDGSKLVFSQSDGSVGTSRNVFLTQVVDPFGNAVTLTYDELLRLVAITDAIGQVTTLEYGLTDDLYRITKVTDPFGRFATFDYAPALVEKIITVVHGSIDETLETDIYGWQLATITDEVGLTSQFTYLSHFVEYAVTGPTTYLVASDLLNSLVTPYGTNTFISADNGNGDVRSLETVYPDGSRDRVEYNQLAGGDADRTASRPTGMATDNQFLSFRNTYYWSRTACATGYGDYTKAKLYHWLHTADLTTTSGILESTKEALEGRVWYDYAGQPPSFTSVVVGENNLPTHVGRVLDDGQTQLYTYAFNGLGNLTDSIDPVGRTLSFSYDTNGIDLLEIRQTRAGNNELLARMTYNAHHRPLTRTDAAGQTTTYTYNARGQMLSATNPKNETITCAYDTNAYLVAIDGRLPGTNDAVKATYDGYGRIRTMTDVSGYTLIFDYDDLDRVARITHPDSTFSQYTYDRLDLVAIRGRAGRHTLFEYDNMRRLTKKSDPLGRVTLFEWCRCGALESLTDPMGRTTSWPTDVQGRRTGKQYGDGSQVKYLYENASSRLRQVIDEKRQVTQYTYNRDNTLHSKAYANTLVPTPSVSYTYDSDYERVASMTDGTGTTIYRYGPITASPFLGAGRLASVDGPLANDTLTYAYDELERRVQTSINGVAATRAFDTAGRLVGDANALGLFTYAYDGSSARVVSQGFPNGQTAAMSYSGNLQDFTLQEMSYAAGATPVSHFVSGPDIPSGRITTWSQQAGAQSPSIFSFGYDAVNQLLSAAVTNSGVAVNDFAYTYDPAGNRLTEVVGGTTKTSTYNALNQLSTTENATIHFRTNEWDAQNRLTAVNAGSNRTEFTYDGLSRLGYIRQLQNGSEISFRRFVWCNGRICEERDKSGAIVNKRFFSEGVKLETGTNAGAYYYTRDHLGSIRELTDAGGNVRARYAYDPFGRRTKLSGDVDADFGFAGMFWSSETSLALTHFRAYDPELGRWLSRDPLNNAEMNEVPNLYAYAANDPVNLADPLGLQAGGEIIEARGEIVEAGGEIVEAGGEIVEAGGEIVEVGSWEYWDLMWARGTISRLEWVERMDPEGLYVRWSRPEPPTGFYGLSRTVGAFVGAGITVLLMTDCNTVQGILGLVRQGKGGVLNIYEDQMLKQIERNP